ncbi:MAG: hypothetical protein JSS35_11565 [Proteobacteria bacterium]|nr:hypothetical protein [Pseudomonadota bacterium]
MDPRPTHLDTTDPANAGLRDIREVADREIDAYGAKAGLVLLMPEDRWDEFLQGIGQEAEGEVTYRGVLFKRAAVTAVVAQEGF